MESNSIYPAGLNEKTYFFHSMGVFVYYINGVKHNDEENYASIMFSFSEVDQVWNLDIIEFTQNSKRSFQLDLNTNISFNIDERIIAWMFDKASEIHNYFYIIENDYYGTITQQIQDVYEAAFSIPKSFEFPMSKKDVEAHGESEIMYYNSEYKLFIPSYRTNKVIGIRKYVGVVLNFEDLSDTFNVSTINLANHDEEITTAILINMETELAYVISSNLKCVYLYNFNTETRTAIQFDHEIVVLCNISQQL